MKCIWAWWDLDKVFPQLPPGSWHKIKLILISLPKSHQGCDCYSRGQATQGFGLLSLKTVDPSLRTHLGHPCESNWNGLGSSSCSACSSSAVQTSSIQLRFAWHSFRISLVPTTYSVIIWPQSIFGAPFQGKAVSMGLVMENFSNVPMRNLCHIWKSLISKMKLIEFKNSTICCTYCKIPKLLWQSLLCMGVKVVQIAGAGLWQSVYTLEVPGCRKDAITVSCRISHHEGRGCFNKWVRPS